MTFTCPPLFTPNPDLNLRAKYSSILPQKEQPQKGRSGMNTGDNPATAILRI